LLYFSVLFIPLALWSRELRGRETAKEKIVFPFGNSILDAGQGRDEEKRSKSFGSQTRES
jgi:hypothetical protein